VLTVVLGHDLLLLFDLSELYSIPQPPDHVCVALYKQVLNKSIHFKTWF